MSIYLFYCVYLSIPYCSSIYLSMMSIYLSILWCNLSISLSFISCVNTSRDLGLRYISICLFILWCLSIYQSPHLSICCLSINLFSYQSVNLSIGSYINLFIHQSVHLSIFSSINQFICQSVHLLIF